jgi:acid phosphatase (class A)
MKFNRRALFTGLAALLVATAGGIAWLGQHTPPYLDGRTDEFIALFPAPPAADSPRTRSELDELLQLQRTRTAAEVAAAQADRKTTLLRFAGALGTDEQSIKSLRRLNRLAQTVEETARPYVRAAKRHFRRLRPSEIEPDITPCIEDVQGDLSYPSGHANYGFLMGHLLSELVPERRVALEARAAEFARQRMVCGVHFPSDIEAGRIAATWLWEALRRNPRFGSDAAGAARELRAALRLGPLENEARAAEAGT